MSFFTIFLSTQSIIYIELDAQHEPVQSFFTNSQFHYIYLYARVVDNLSHLSLDKEGIVTAFIAKKDHGLAEKIRVCDFYIDIRTYVRNGFSHYVVDM